MPAGTPGPVRKLLNSIRGLHTLNKADPGSLKGSAVLFVFQRLKASKGP